jgi:outer membrane lipoprotein-sorting protein
MRRACLWLGLAIALAGCPQSHPVTRPYPPPAPDALVAALRARQAAVPGMNARVRATSWLSGERVRATVNMLVERDGRLRFEAEVSLQGTVATLATDAGSFALLDARKNELSRGPACPANVASLIRIPLAPEEVAAILLGDARMPEGAAAAATVDWDANAGTDVLALPDGAGGALQVLFRGTGADRRLVGANRVGAGGARVWRTAYEDLTRTGEEWLPGTIRFAEGNGSFDDGVEIRFRDRTIGATPPAGAFTLAPPPGVAVREVGCGPR